MLPNFLRNALLSCLLPAAISSAQQLAAGIARAIAFVKADTVAPQLQKEFFEQSNKPLDTKQ